VPDICKGWCDSSASFNSARGFCDNCDEWFNRLNNIPIPSIFATLPEYCFGTGTYFVKCGEFVKIGRTADIETRMQTLKTANPLDLELLKFTHFKDIERESHKRFKHLKHRDEWYHLTPELEAYIAVL